MLFPLEVYIIITSLLQMKNYVLRKSWNWSRLTHLGKQEKRWESTAQEYWLMLPEKIGCRCQLIQDSEPHLKNSNIIKNILKVKRLGNFKEEVKMVVC